MAFGWKCKSEVQNTHQFRRPADFSPHAFAVRRPNVIDTFSSEPGMRRTLHKSEIIKEKSECYQVAMRIGSKEPAEDLVPGQFSMSPIPIQFNFVGLLTRL